jgi:hypothetical protein
MAFQILLRLLTSSWGHPYLYGITSFTLVLFGATQVASKFEERFHVEKMEYSRSTKKDLLFEKGKILKVFLDIFMNDIISVEIAQGTLVVKVFFFFKHI